MIKSNKGIGTQTQFKRTKKQNKQKSIAKVIMVKH